MLTQTIDPVFLQVGPFAFHYYGLFFAAGILFSIWLLDTLLKQRKIELGKEGLSSLAFYLVAGMLIGARLGSVLSDASFYLNNPLHVFALWNGGMAFHGGLAGVVLAGWLFATRKKLPFASIADLVVVPIPLALALGRVANFINGEFYGPATSLPWGVVFPAVTEARHPTQLYEALLMIVLFAALWMLKEKKLPAGTLFATFLLGYGSLRFAVEYLKEDVLQLGILTWGQLWSIPMVLVGAVMLWKRRKTR